VFRLCEVGSPELLDLNRALDELNVLDPAKVQLVELRYFLGCTAEETASLMDVSKATVDRELKFVKSWIFRRLHPGLSRTCSGERAKSLSGKKGLMKTN